MRRPLDTAARWLAILAVVLHGFAAPAMASPRLHAVICGGAPVVIDLATGRPALPEARCDGCTLCAPGTTPAVPDATSAGTLATPAPWRLSAPLRDRSPAPGLALVRAPPPLVSVPS